jgi:hypothetical protein
VNTYVVGNILDHPADQNHSKLLVHHPGHIQLEEDHHKHVPRQGLSHNQIQVHFLCQHSLQPEADHDGHAPHQVRLGVDHAGHVPHQEQDHLLRQQFLHHEDDKASHVLYPGQGHLLHQKTMLQTRVLHHQNLHLEADKAGQVPHQEQGHLLQQQILHPEAHKTGHVPHQGQSNHLQNREDWLDIDKLVSTGSMGHSLQHKQIHNDHLLICMLNVGSKQHLRIIMTATMISSAI